ncbi:hypothetical protein [Francisella orientalis]|uniref:Uncharacterized protein n=1 Tax=Francisella orientalis TaxID=299583 RepID=A0AAP6X7I7_9GAMM|nr:hypothetical protein [Francisella orientalis]AFJ43976.1 hypothetical protein OOM_1596 [Francisella orientalis str. Toba 04]AHB98608.1 hypothetical protein M973_07100 [Francisella orientalis LADL 07-285A]AKN85857.1 hypothetical protein FNO12_1272 [Francisella orientalis FNO12]AKN87396.1 Hypothetical protein FNO24_1274 [Francisella orientalis FNO24]AKN88933.1 Hypothetical protein FNO190_1272 [Francisella orientalis]
MNKDKLNILVIKGYYSKGDSVEHIDIDGIKAKITTVALGRPVFVKRKLKRIINKYKVGADNYDLIYAISMSAGISSLIDEALYQRLHLITPFFIHHKTMRVLGKIRIRKMLGAYLLLLFNGKLGKFHEAIKVTLAENDNVVDNKFFESTWGNVNLIKGIDHTLTKEVVEYIIRKDIENLRKEVFGGEEVC